MGTRRSPLLASDTNLQRIAIASYYFFRSVIVLASSDALAVSQSQISLRQAYNACREAGLP
ncbi:MAG: hypothetical protein ACYCOU_25925, partial [Sulfobacillus sp.]